MNDKKDFFGKLIDVGDEVCIAACDRNPKFILGVVTAIDDSHWSINILTHGNRNTLRKPNDVIVLKKSE